MNKKSITAYISTAFTILSIVTIITVLSIPMRTASAQTQESTAESSDLSAQIISDLSQEQHEQEIFLAKTTAKPPQDNTKQGAQLAFFILEVLAIIAFIIFYARHRARKQE